VIKRKRAGVHGVRRPSRTRRGDCKEESERLLEHGDVNEAVVTVILDRQRRYPDAE
jgi:hypothetical protein